MTDYAIIALSPAWRGDLRYFRKEKDKALLLYQYLKKLNYEIKFLAPDFINIPFETEPCNRPNFLCALEYISNTADSESNIIYFISDSPKSKYVAVNNIYLDLIRILREKITDEKQVNNTIMKLAPKILSKRKRGISVEYLCEKIKELPTTGTETTNLEKLICFMENITRNEIPLLPDSKDFFDYLERSEFSNLATGKHISKQIIEYTPKHLDSGENLEFKYEVLHKISDFILQKYTHYTINIMGFIDLLRKIHQYCIIEKVHYFQFSRWNTPNETIRFSEVETILDQTICNTMTMIGSGHNSEMIAKEFKDPRRVTIGSMGELKKGQVDHFNYANGLVKASFYNLQTYDKSDDNFQPIHIKTKPIDPLKAFSLELIRLGKIGALQNQSPIIFFDMDHLINKGRNPVLPLKDPNTVALRYNPRIGAFIPFGTSPPPVIKNIPMNPLISGGGTVTPGV